MEYFVKGDIINFHLITGEDIVAAFDSVDDHNYIVKKPVVPNISMDPQAQRFSVGMLPLRPYLGMVERLVLPESHVVYALPVNEQMGQLYQQFTSNIIIASPAELPSLTDRTASLLKG